MGSESKSADMRHNSNDGRSEYSKVQRNRNIRNGLIFIAPNFIGFFILILIPVLTLFYTSFTKWSALGEPEFNGLKNWRRMFTDESFLTATGNTLLYAAVHIPLTLALAFALAVLLNSKIKGRAFFRTVAFFPYIPAIVAVAQVWIMMFDAKSGIINQFLGLFTNNPPGWLSDTHWAMVAVIIVGTWREVGYFMILLLAGLQTIPSELYEAAEVDGANAWQQFWKITMPMLTPTIFFNLIQQIINGFRVFTESYVITDGGPMNSTLTYVLYLYRSAFANFHMGYSCALAWILVAIIGVMTLILFKSQNSWVHYEG